MPCLQADVTSPQQSAADIKQQLALVSEQLSAAQCNESADSDLASKTVSAVCHCMPCLQADLTSSQQSAADKQQQLTLASEQLTAAEGKAADLSKLRQDTVQQLQEQEALLNKVTGPRHQNCSLCFNSTFPLALAVLHFLFLFLHTAQRSQAQADAMIPS